MWLNEQQVCDSAICQYQESLLHSSPNHIVIDNLFNTSNLEDIIKKLQQAHCWQTQKHTYAALYVDNAKWQRASAEQRFVQRDVWLRKEPGSDTASANIADDFLSFLRGREFMSLLSRIFNVQLTDMNVADPAINTNYFRLGPADFVGEHADDSPGREVCMLLYLNKNWQHDSGGELVFMGQNNRPIRIAPLYNRCVLFDPSSKGSEHWVAKMNSNNTDKYRYNVTSWYWSE